MMFCPYSLRDGLCHAAATTRGSKRLDPHLRRMGEKTGLFQEVTQALGLSTCKAAHTQLAHCKFIMQADTHMVCMPTLCLCHTHTM